MKGPVKKCLRRCIPYISVTTYQHGFDGNLLVGVALMVGGEDRSTVGASPSLLL